VAQQDVEPPQDSRAIVFITKNGDAKNGVQHVHKVESTELLMAKQDLEAPQDGPSILFASDETTRLRNLKPDKSHVLFDLYKNTPNMLGGFGPTRVANDKLPATTSISTSSSATPQKESLTIGDQVEYYHPLYIWGNKMGLRVAVINKITNEEDHWGDTRLKVYLSDMTTLTGDNRVKKIDIVARH
jgi:hypothetical protein